MRVLLAGAGAWAASLHAPAIAGVPGVGECVIWSRDASRARRLAGEYGMRPAGDLAGEMAAADVVVCSVPPWAQAELVVQHARDGIRFVLEKPLAADAGQCRAVLSALARYRVPSLHVLTYRFMPAVSAALEAVRGKETGPLRASVGYRSAFHLSSEAAWRRRAGVLPDIGPHLFDLAHWVLGRITAIEASTDRDGTVRCELVHLGGGRSAVSMNATDGTAPRRLMWVEVSAQDGKRILAKVGPDAFARNDSFLASYRAQLTAFCSRATAKGEPDATHGAYLVDVVEAARRSLASGRPAGIANSS